MEASETTKPPEIESNLTKLLAFKRKQPSGKPSGNQWRRAIMGWDMERNIMRALVVPPGSWAIGCQNECRGVSGTRDFSLAGRFTKWSSLLGCGNVFDTGCFQYCFPLPIPPNSIILMVLTYIFKVLRIFMDFLVIRIY